MDTLKIKLKIGRILDDHSYDTGKYTNGRGILTADFNELSSDIADYFESLNISPIKTDGIQTHTKKLTIKSSSDKLHLERVLRCVSMNFETDGWPTIILDDIDIRTLIDYLNAQLTIIESIKKK
jgi:hypothetical protein